MTTIAAPVIVQEMGDWTKLGGGNSGIVGNRDHRYGFHLGAEDIPRGDYSRWRDSNGSDGPFVDWRYACAGDFSHKNDPKLRAMHRKVLARLMAGELPMICEFIGKPWANKPVYYWARWNKNPDGTFKLLRYTGSGHDHWSHIAWERSKVDKRAYLWRDEEVTPAQMKQLAEMSSDMVIDKLLNKAKTKSRVSGRQVSLVETVLAGGHMYGHNMHEELIPDLQKSINILADQIVELRGEIQEMKQNP